MTRKKIIIATGGTGGHVFPAYSLANYLDKKYHVLLTSDERGLNYLKSYKNINFIKIPASPIINTNIFKFLYSLITIIYSTIKSFLFLIFFRPKIIIGMGGYSSFPVCIAAFALRIKFITYENNLIIGKANKYLLPFANKLLVSYKDLEGVPKKYNDKVIEIGNILRQEIIYSNIYNEEVNRFNNINVLVLGGSQAARTFADELPPIFKKLKNSKLPIKVFQQCQKKQNKQLSMYYEKAEIKYEIFNFTDKIIDYYSRANLVITRSGASVLGELINVNIPFIAIPLPTSADNHQHKNAEFYEKKGYGYLLREKDIKNKLFDLIKLIFEDKLLLKNILLNQKKYSDKDIFIKLKTQIEKIINEKY